MQLLNSDRITSSTPIGTSDSDGSFVFSPCDTLVSPCVDQDDQYWHGVPACAKPKTSYGCTHWVDRDNATALYTRCIAGVNGGEGIVSSYRTLSPFEHSISFKVTRLIPRFGAEADNDYGITMTQRGGDLDSQGVTFRTVFTFICDSYHTPKIIDVDVPKLSVSTTFPA